MLELLLALSILAVLAVGASHLVGSSVSQARQAAAGAEMRQVARAIQRFHQDTGFWPRQGPFAIEASGGEVVADSSHPPDHPANLSQLFDSPEDSSGDAIMEWNLDTGRGWNGPYLDRFGEGGVLVGAGLAATGAGDPADGTLTWVDGVADPFTRPALSGGAMAWRALPVTHDDFASAATVSRGRPYLLFVNSAAASNVTGCVVPCLVGMGVNGQYEEGDGDDLVFNLK